MAANNTPPDITGIENAEVADEICVLPPQKTSSDHTDISKDSHSNSQSDSLSDFDVFMHLVNGHAGVGILGIPYAMTYSGTVLGVIMIVALGLVYIIACRMIIVSGQAVMDKHNQKVAEYNTMLRLIYIDDPKTGKFMDHLVGVAIYIMHFGYWVAYFIFLTTNVKDLSIHWFPALAKVPHYNIWVYVVVCVFLLILCSFDLSGGMTTISLIGSLSILGGLVAISTSAGLGITGKEKLPNFNFAGIPVAFGMIISAYEAQATSISVYNDARNRKRFMPIFCMVVALYASFMIASGVIGYIRFGGAVKGNWLANMPNNPTLAAIKIMYSIAVSMTYPIMCVVTNRLYTPRVEKLAEKWFENSTSIADYTVRYSSVLLPCVIAYIFPFFGDICGLVGCLGSTMMGMIIPPIMDNKMMPQDWQSRTRNLIIVGLGLFGGTSGTVETMKNIIRKVKHK